MPILRQLTRRPAVQAGLTKCRTSKFPKIYKLSHKLIYKCRSVLISVLLSNSNFNSNKIQTVAFKKGFLKSWISLCIFRLICLFWPSIILSLAQQNLVLDLFKAFYDRNLNLNLDKCQGTFYGHKSNLILQSKLLITAEIHFLRSKLRVITAEISGPLLSKLTFSKWSKFSFNIVLNTV